MARPLKVHVQKSYVTTDGQPASLSWNKAPIWGLRPDLYYCLTVAGLLTWGALSDERTGLSFAIATGPRQRNSRTLTQALSSSDHSQSVRLCSDLLTRYKWTRVVSLGTDHIENTSTTEPP
jgi:hypothetical protein